MAFPARLTSKMSGATKRQLSYWRSEGILVPEIENESRPYLYSFRDIVALRTFAWLRGSHSLFLIRQSLATLRDMDLFSHPSNYKLIKLGSSIGVVLADGDAVDVALEPGQMVAGTLAEVFAEFYGHNGQKVDDLLHPRQGVEVDPERLGGWPTIRGTRIPYDTIASLVSDGTIRPEDVGHYYPGVSAAAARDALDYHEDVLSVPA